ncbi:MAG: hypothetical protein KGL73_12755 [Burkholderiales bacterium]|nr:hypothetical protein [Burkholderiales bacterium]
MLPADLPLVLPETLRRIADAPDEQTVVRPVCLGQQGRPARFSRDCAANMAPSRSCAGIGRGPHRDGRSRLRDGRRYRAGTGAGAAPPAVTQRSLKQDHWRAITAQARRGPALPVGWVV